MQQKFTLALAALTTFVQPSLAGYGLADDYSPDNFFSMFNFFTATDPTHGTVEYVSQSEAEASGLAKNMGDSIYMGVDNTSIATGGRKSVRITSNKAYNNGLVVLDVAHMPSGCGTWPAFWMTGPNWPNAGEIDIIEGVNDQSSNSMTLHTSSGCSISKAPMTGQIMTSNCDVNAVGQSNNQGCGISAGSAASTTYGSGFNDIDGGVYATEWTGQAIKIWFFPRTSIPSDALGSNPNPDAWGEPVASFEGDCPIDSHFKDLNIVFDTTFCGDWAGNTWSSSSTCSAKASSCEDYVRNNPSAFSDAFWNVKSLKVYTNDGSASSGSGSSPFAPSSVIAPPAIIPSPSVAVSLGINLPAPAVTSAPAAPVALSEVMGQSSSDAPELALPSGGAPQIVHLSNVEAAAATPTPAPAPAPAPAPTSAPEAPAPTQAPAPAMEPQAVVVPQNGGPLQEAPVQAPEPAEGELDMSYFHHPGGKVKKHVHRHALAHAKNFRV